MNMRALRQAAFALTGFLGLAYPLAAGVWDGTADNDWGNGLNWEGDAPPAAGEDILFPEASNQTVRLNGARAVASFLFNASGPYRLSNGALTFGTNLVQQGAGSVTLENDLHLGASLSFTGTGSGTVSVHGAIGGTNAQWKVLVDVTNHTVVLAGTNSFLGSLWLTNGTLLVTGVHTGNASFHAAGTASNRLILGSSSDMPLGTSLYWRTYTGANLFLQSADETRRVVRNQLYPIGSGGSKTYLTFTGSGPLDFPAGVFFNMNGCSFHAGVDAGATATVGRLEWRLGVFYKRGPGTLVLEGESAWNAMPSLHPNEGTLVLAHTNLFFSSLYHDGPAGSTSILVLAATAPAPFGTGGWTMNGYSPSTFIVRQTGHGEKVIPNAISLPYSGQYLLGFEGPGPFRLTNGLSLRNVTLTFSNTNPRVTIEGGIPLTGAGVTFIKAGSGTLAIETNGVATLFQSVREGTLLVNGQITNTVVPLTVSPCATLGGNGSIGQPVMLASNAVLSPGDGGVGLLAVSNLTFNTNAVYAWDFLDGAADQCAVANTLTLRGDQPATLRLVDGGRGILTPDQEFTLFTYGGAHPSNPAWNFEFVGTRWKRTNAVVQVDTAGKRVVLSGLSIPPAGTVVTLR